MHYYPFNIGDYRKDTIHLTLLEHGIYRLLIDTYYLDECPLPTDLKELMRQHSIRTQDDKEAFNNVLNDFFVLKNDGYHHSGCDKVLEKIYAKSESARASAKARWDKSIRNSCQKDANAQDNHANAQKSDANDMLPNTHNPIPKDKKAIASVNQESIIELYNSICTDLPKCRNLTDKRRKRLNAQSKKTVNVKGNDYSCNELEFWENYFLLINSIDWLNGRTGKTFNIDFDYVIREENIIKFCESI